MSRFEPDKARRIPLCAYWFDRYGGMDVTGTVAVTGAAGHIGATLVRALVDEGRTVRALVHQDTTAIEGLDIERAQGDVLDIDSLRRAFDGAETVYHAAAVITLRSRRDPMAWRVNTEGPANVAQACLDCGVKRVVHFSSIHAFSPHPKDGVVDESRPRTEDPKGWVYDRSKAEGERVMLRHVDKGLDAVIVNPTGVLGRNDFRLSHMGHVLLDLKRGRMPALVKGGFNWVDVRDVCAGAMAAERAGRTGENYLLSGHYLSVRQLAKHVARIAGGRVPLFTVPLWVAALGIPFSAAKGALLGEAPRVTRASLFALHNHQQISHEKASRELGYEPHAIEETVEDALAWLDTRGRF